MPPETPEQIYAQNLEEGVVSTDPSSPIGIQPSSENTAISLCICREKTTSTWCLLVGLCMCECVHSYVSVCMCACTALCAKEELRGQNQVS